MLAGFITDTRCPTAFFGLILVKSSLIFLCKE
jgi:hypothetical protein